MYDLTGALTDTNRHTNVCKFLCDINEMRLATNEFKLSQRSVDLPVCYKRFQSSRNLYALSIS